jgi:hypothetical protein
MCGDGGWLGSWLRSGAHSITGSALQAKTFTPLLHQTLAQVFDSITPLYGSIKSAFVRCGGSATISTGTVQYIRRNLASTNYTVHVKNFFVIQSIAALKPRSRPQNREISFYLCKRGSFIN